MTTEEREKRIELLKNRLLFFDVNGLKEHYSGLIRETRAELVKLIILEGEESHETVT